MDQPTPIVFEVDGQYENEKGVFTVVSIQRDEMVIRWENGEEIVTEIDLQRRIAERRQREKYDAELKAKAAAKPARKSKAAAEKAQFGGFAPTDFKKSASGTTWRSRSQLGKAVIQNIKATGLKLNSWAFGRKPEMHVQDVKHRGSEANDDQARFFVRLDPATLYFGFRVSRPQSDADSQKDWDAVTKWLADEKNEETLHELAVKAKLTACDQRSPADKTWQPAEKGWQAENAKGAEPKETLVAWIDDTPAGEGFDLEIATSLAKDEAVSSGPKIAAKIGELFSQLLPLYKAAVAG